MRIVGVVAEYNPFHNGHAWHLQKAREHAKADYVIAVMSSCFTQRGTAACLSPRARAEMALNCGADAVIALPAFWAVRDAEHFALGGVSLLHQMGIDAISFGAETAVLPLLRDAASLLEHADADFDAAVLRHLDEGQSYPFAVAAAADERAAGLGALLASPNNTLGICYLRAMQRLHADMDVSPIAREGNYHATFLEKSFPSATAIRGCMERGDWAALGNTIPAESLPTLKQAALDGRVHKQDALDQALMYRLRSMTDAEWHALPGLSEGIEDRLCAAAQRAGTREELILRAKTRRYPYARLSRLCTHALLHITQAMLDQQPLPDAAWLLGFRREARPLLTHISQHAQLISKASDVKSAAPWFRTECLAYDLWALGCGLPAGLAMTQGVARV